MPKKASEYSQSELSKMSGPMTFKGELAEGVTRFGSFLGSIGYEQERQLKELEEYKNERTWSGWLADKGRDVASTFMGGRGSAALGYDPRNRERLFGFAGPGSLTDPRAGIRIGTNAGEAAYNITHGQGLTTRDKKNIWYAGGQIASDTLDILSITGTTSGLSALGQTGRQAGRIAGSRATEEAIRSGLARDAAEQFGRKIASETEKKVTKEGGVKLLGKEFLQGDLGVQSNPSNAAQVADAAARLVGSPPNVYTPFSLGFAGNAARQIATGEIGGAASGQLVKGDFGRALAGKGFQLANRTFARESYTSLGHDLLDTPEEAMYRQEQNSDRAKAKREQTNFARGIIGEEPQETQWKRAELKAAESSEYMPKFLRDQVKRFQDTGGREGMSPRAAEGHKAEWIENTRRSLETGPKRPWEISNVGPRDPVSRKAWADSLKEQDAKMNEARRKAGETEEMIKQKPNVLEGVTKPKPQRKMPWEKYGRSTEGLDAERTKLEKEMWDLGIHPEQIKKSKAKQAPIDEENKKFEQQNKPKPQSSLDTQGPAVASVMSLGDPGDSDATDSYEDATESEPGPFTGGMASLSPDVPEDVEFSGPPSSWKKSCQCEQQEMPEPWKEDSFVGLVLKGPPTVLTPKEKRKIEEDRTKMPASDMQDAYSRLPDEPTYIRDDSQPGRPKQAELRGVGVGGPKESKIQSQGYIGENRDSILNPFSSGNEKQRFRDFLSSAYQGGKVSAGAQGGALGRYGFDVGVNIGADILDMFTPIKAGSYLRGDKSAQSGYGVTGLSDWTREPNVQSAVGALVPQSNYAMGAYEAVTADNEFESARATAGLIQQAGADAPFMIPDLPKAPSQQAPRMGILETPSQKTPPQKPIGFSPPLPEEVVKTRRGYQPADPFAKDQLSEGFIPRTPLQAELPLAQPEEPMIYRGKTSSESGVRATTPLEAMPAVPYEEVGPQVERDFQMERQSGSNKQQSGPYSQYLDELQKQVNAGKSDTEASIIAKGKVESQPGLTVTDKSGKVYTAKQGNVTHADVMRSNGLTPDDIVSTGGGMGGESVRQENFGSKVQRLAETDPLGQPFDLGVSKFDPSLEVGQTPGATGPTTRHGSRAFSQSHDPAIRAAEMKRTNLTQHEGIPGTNFSYNAGPSEFGLPGFEGEVQVPSPEFPEKKAMSCNSNAGYLVPPMWYESED